MKKTLSLFLAVLMIFSAFSATLAFAAEGEIHKVSFIDYDGTVIVIKDVPYGATTKCIRRLKSLSLWNASTTE